MAEFYIVVHLFVFFVHFMGLGLIHREMIGRSYRGKIIRMEAAGDRKLLGVGDCKTVRREKKQPLTRVSGQWLFAGLY